MATRWSELSGAPRPGRPPVKPEWNTASASPRLILGILSPLDLMQHADPPRLRQPAVPDGVRRHRCGVLFVTWRTARRARGHPWSVLGPQLTGEPWTTAGSGGHPR